MRRFAESFQEKTLIGFHNITRIDLLRTSSPSRATICQSHHAARRQTTETMVSVGTTTFPFLKLAPELRNNIYHFALVRPADHDFIVGGTIEEPGLLRTCRQIRSEAADIFYLGGNRFTIVLDNRDRTNTRQWLRMQKRMPLLRHVQLEFADWKFNITDWQQFKDFLVFVHRRSFSSVLGLSGLGPQSSEPGPKMILVLWVMVLGMQSDAWEDVEAILESMRPTMASFHAMWAEKGSQVVEDLSYGKVRAQILASLSINTNVQMLGYLDGSSNLKLIRAIEISAVRCCIR